MRLDDFDFDLPPEQIAQFPAPVREASRLMVLDRSSSSISTGVFPDICDYFKAGDVLVLNDTRVIPARLLGQKESGGKIEVFLVQRLASDQEDWVCLTKSSKSPQPGTRLLLGEGLDALVLPGAEGPLRHIRFQSQGSFSQALERVGRIPLPPYIRREDNDIDRERYQTVFARAEGAVAAPTAGLHFTDSILNQLRERGVQICSVTLHVGLGTFFPVRVDDVREHRMHGERYNVPAATVAAVKAARARGSRVFALGTTTTRTLEHAVDQNGILQAGDGVSDLFIYPGFSFQVVDCLVTNFHLPRSTLLMLVSGFAGQDFVLDAYRRAVAEGFRFFSYGDCMLIV